MKRVSTRNSANDQRNERTAGLDFIPNRADMFMTCVHIRIGIGALGNRKISDFTKFRGNNIVASFVTSA